MGSAVQQITVLLKAATSLIRKTTQLDLHTNDFPNDIDLLKKTVDDHTKAVAVLAKKLMRTATLGFYVELLKDLVNHSRVMDSNSSIPVQDPDIIEAYHRIEGKVRKTDGSPMDLNDVPVPQAGLCKVCSTGESCDKPACKTKYMALAINQTLREFRELAREFVPRTTGHTIPWIHPSQLDLVKKEVLQADRKLMRTDVVLYSYSMQLQNINQDYDMHNLFPDFSHMRVYLSDRPDRVLTEVLEIAGQVKASTALTNDPNAKRIYEQTKILIKNVLDTYVGTFLNRKQAAWWIKMGALMESVFESELPALPRLEGASFMQLLDKIRDDLDITLDDAMYLPDPVLDGEDLSRSTYMTLERATYIEGTTSSWNSSEPSGSDSESESEPRSESGSDSGSESRPESGSDSDYDSDASFKKLNSEGWIVTLKNVMLVLMNIPQSLYALASVERDDEDVQSTLTIYLTRFQGLLTETLNSPSSFVRNMPNASIRKSLLSILETTQKEFPIILSDFKDPPPESLNAHVTFLETTIANLPLEGGSGKRRRKTFF